MTRSIDRRGLLAIVVAVLAVTAVPASVVSATDALAVGSQHDTQSEFDNAQTLNNLTTTSSGDGAVELKDIATFADSFEGDATDAGIPDNWEETSDGGASHNVTTQYATDGSQSYATDDGSSIEIVRPQEQPLDTNTTENVSYDIRVANDTTKREIGLLDSGGNGVKVVITDGNLTYFDGSSNVISSAVQPGEWISVTIYNVDPGSDTFAVKWSSPSDSGTATGLSMHGDMASSGYQTTRYVVYADDGGPAYLDDFRIGGESPDSSTYLSPVHNVTDGEEAAINITALTNASVTATVRTPSGTTLNQTTLSTTGNHSLQLTSYSGDKIEVKLDINISGSSPAFTLADESILFSNHHPEVDNASASPSGGETVSETPVTLSINVSDEDFNTAQGDNATVTFYDGGGNQLDTDTLTSNGTATGTWDSPPGGERQWYVVVEDDYGETTTSDTFSFKAPDTLYIRNESDPDALVDSATVEVTFFASDKVVERSTTNGTIDLSGLPTDEKIVVVADADDYYSRHIILDNIYEQDSVYLLNNTETAVDVTFTNADETGEWPPETTEVIVEKGLTQNNSTTYRTLAADEFGVSGFSTTLAKDERYRIKVRNARGDVRILGSHTSSQDETVPLRPVPTGIELNDTKPYNGIAYYENVTTSDGYEERIVFEYEDKADGTTDLVINIYEQGNESNTLGSETTIDGPLGSAVVSEVMTDEQANKTWIVDWEAQRNGETIGGQIIVGPDIHEQVSELDQWVREAIAVFVVIMTAALFSQLNRGVGAVSTSLVGGGFWYTGWLPAEAGGAIGLALGVAIAYKIARGQEGAR